VGRVPGQRRDGIVRQRPEVPVEVDALGPVGLAVAAEQLADARQGAQGLVRAPPRQVAYADVDGKPVASTITKVVKK
jgi:hypothetical protein